MVKVFLTRLMRYGWSRGHETRLGEYIPYREDYGCFNCGGDGQIEVIGEGNTIPPITCPYCEGYQEIPYSDEVSDIPKLLEPSDPNSFLLITTEINLLI